MSRVSPPAAGSEQVSLAVNQQLIWRGQQLRPQDPLYEVHYVYRFAGELDPKRFQRAFLEVVRANEVLRIVPLDESWSCPVLSPAEEHACVFIDLANEFDAERSSQQQIGARLHGRFDVTRSLCEATLIRSGKLDWTVHLVLHHVMTDALGGQAFWSQLSGAYQEPHTETPPPVACYSDWRETNLRQTNDPGDQAWWTSRVRRPPQTEFYRAASRVLGSRHTREVVRLSSAENALIQGLAAESPFRQITPSLSHFNVFATALASFLARVSGVDDISIGSTQHGRDRPQWKEAIGLFMQLLPMRVSIARDETFASLSRKMASETRGWFSHAKPGVMTPELVQSFDVALNLIDLRVGDFAGCPTQMEWLHNGYGDPSRRLTLSPHCNQEGQWELLFDFSDDAFSEDDRAKVIQHFRQTLCAMSTDVGGNVSTFALTDRGNVQRYGAFDRALVSDAAYDVWHQFQEVSQRLGKKPAVRGLQRELSFDDVREDALEIAAQLNRQRAGNVVPVICRRDESAIVALFGVWASGRCVMVVDAEQPEHRRREILGQSDSNLVIDALGVPRIRPNQWQSASQCQLQGRACYILFTSGSTGVPNGVVVGHASIGNLLADFERLAPLQEDSVCSWWTNVGFDVAMYEILSALLFGRTLAIPSHATRLDAEEMLGWIDKNAIRSAYLPPFFLEQTDARLKSGDTLPLQRLLVGVEPIPQRLLSSITRRMPDLTLINGYGPTEATVCATLEVIAADDDRDGPASIGVPVSGNVIRIVDGSGNDVPEGVTGELWISGSGLAFGYFANDPLTESCFPVHTNRFGQKVRWYRTGDRVRMRDDGRLQFGGRKDDQIKVSGVRVELGDVIAAIRGCEAVADAHVFATRAENGDYQLSALVQTLSLQVRPADVRKQLRSRLRSAMVPKHLYVVDQIPRNANGKVDSAAIASLIETYKTAEQSPEERPPKSVAEFVLLTLMRELLEVDGFGAEDDFFESGGTSLDAMNLVTRLKELGMETSVEDIFAGRTVAGIARCSETSCSKESDGQAVSDPEKVSDGVRGIWTFQQLHPDSAAYHISVRLDCDGNVDHQELRRAFRLLVNRHPVLRTCCESIDGKLTRVLKTADQIEFHHRQNEIGTRELLAHCKRPFDLARETPLRVLHLSSQDDDDVIVLTFHHIAVDELSIRNLLAELSAVFAGRRLPEVNDVVPRENEIADIDWWADWLEGCERNLILGDKSWQREQIKDHEGAYHTFRCSRELSDSVREAASRCGVTVGTYLFTAFSVMLSRYTGESSHTIGCPLQRSGIDSNPHWVGYGIETLPVSCRIRPEISVADNCRHLHDKMAKLLQFRDSSASDLESHFGPLFNAVFAHRLPLEPVALGEGREAIASVSDLGVAKFDLTWFAGETPDGIEAAVEYRTGLFHQDSIERMTQHWQALLKQFAQHDETPVAELSMLTPSDEEAHRALNAASTNRVRDDSSETVLDAFRHQCLRNPDAIALSTCSDAVSYNALNRRSDQLAAQLAESEVTSATVGICAENSAETLIAILGVMKAGFAYVPMDPASPTQRIKDIIRSADIKKAVLGDRRHENLFEQVFPLPQDATPEIDPGHSPVSIGGDDLAYVLHTSGSTGAPKGVSVEHHALWNSTRARLNFYGASPQRFLLVSPNWFDSSIAGIFGTLCSGGQLVIASPEEVRDLASTADLIEQHSVTETLMLPSLYQLLVKHADASRLKSLKRVIVAGEACPPSLVRQHEETLPSVKLFNEYGPTEATVWATSHELIPSQQAVSIGRSVGGVETLLLDENLNSVPVGLPGEICLAGDRLAKGYYGDPELTDERFIQDPRPERDGRLYRTGDLGQLNVDGTLTFLGRKDSQVKINGRRTELAEIESALLEVPGVLDAGVGLVPVQRNQLASEPESLVDRLNELAPEIAEELLSQAETSAAPSNRSAVEVVQMEDERFRLSMEMKQKGLIATPRERQRKWLLDQVLRETASNLNELHRVASQFVPGDQTPHLPRNLAADQLSEQEIMEDWQTPLMRAMADWATESHGDVLEIGFGRGVAATMIQSFGVRTHTVIEMNPHSIKDHFHPWRERHSDRAIRLVEGRWQDVMDELEDYDAVFFHAFPMNEQEFMDYVATSATFAEHFFPVAARLLRPGGAFTYLTTEINSLSRRHQRSLLEHFEQIQMKVQPLEVPEDTKDAWWADSMVLVRAIK
ncbi:MAG: amino acid adenylation domain-containing protein [Planctomycetota bacterium]